MIPETKVIWRSGGPRWLDELQLADDYLNRIGSLRDLIELNVREIVQAVHRFGDARRPPLRRCPTSTASAMPDICVRGPG